MVRNAYHNQIKLTQPETSVISDLPIKLATTRNGVSFAQCLSQCVKDAELVVNYDRLRGTNLGLRGSPIELSIDESSGRLASELEAFIEFCWDCIFMRFGS